MQRDKPNLSTKLVVLYALRWRVFYKEMKKYIKLQTLGKAILGKGCVNAIFSTKSVNVKFKTNFYVVYCIHHKK